jgi:YesN/AraC family two-component response regulator
MSGVELFEHIKSTHPEVIKILLTGYSDLESAIAAVNLGEVYRYFTKPWNESEIIATVQSAIEYLNLKSEKDRAFGLNPSSKYTTQ